MQSSEPWGDPHYGRRLWCAMGASLLLMIIGVVGYILLEDWSTFDALYMTIITLTTVGYGEVHPLSAAGKGFTMVLLIAGGVIVAYVASTAGQFILAGQLQAVLTRRRLEKMIEKLTDHFIVCAFSDTGKQVIADLCHQNIPFVVIEKDREVALQQGLQYPVITGDATLEEVLLAAGIERARGILVCLNNDADNVFITLTARGLNPHLHIVAQANMPHSETKLIKAGADRVISPFVIGGHRMASAALRPNIVDFLEVVMGSGSHPIELQMEEFIVQEGSELVERSLRDSRIRSFSGAIVMAIKRGEHFTINPSPDFVFQGADRLIALGTTEQLNHLKQLTSP